MKAARPWVRLLGLAAMLLLAAVAMPPSMVWWARGALIAAGIFALLAVNAYFDLTILTGEPKNKERQR